MTAANDELKEKEERLFRFFKDYPKAALAFSGGVDSAYLFYAACRAGCDVQAFYADSAFNPAFELADARHIAQILKRELKVVELDVLACPEAVANGPRRCYYCKRAIFSALWQVARASGFDLLLDGNNASDDAGDRPGMQACRELQVVSPLREAGLTKADVRALSREAGLFTWNKPSYSCLATRVAQNQTITKDLLQRIESGENTLTELGFSDFRLRIRGENALLQVTAGQMEQARSAWDTIEARLLPLFSQISLDDEPRKGSI
ncbi:MAG: ATP-dependent sacrificial sulfur transferase LarE [Firmicutes bacterium]|nr:ATP-dependent sacrificial sulfur transferase LarE [Bacillota bacterium]